MVRFPAVRVFVGNGRWKDSASRSMTESWRTKWLTKFSSVSVRC